MKLAPLIRYAPPRYPTESILRENPAFLTALPNRWRNNRFALGTLASVLTLSAQWQALAQENAATSGSNPRVAPLFIHGEGKGAYGCMVTNPPMFLTEGDAREVIETEMKKAGLQFPEAKFAHTIANVDIPITYIYPPDETEKKEPKTRKGMLSLTGYNSKKQIGYVFISVDDIKKWEKKIPGNGALFPTTALWMPPKHFNPASPHAKGRKLSRFSMTR